MKAFLALTRIDLKLALRNRSVLFFNYFFPLIFFFVFGSLYTNLFTFTGLVGLAVALNGSPRQPDAAEMAESPDAVFEGLALVPAGKDPAQLTNF